MAFSFQLSVNLLRFATPKSKVDNIIHYKWAMDRHSPWSSCDEWGVWSFGPRCWQHRLCKDIKVWQLSIYPLSDFLHISYDIVMNTKRCIHDTLLYKNIILIDIIVLPKKKNLRMLVHSLHHFWPRPKALEIEAKEKHRGSKINMEPKNKGDFQVPCWFSTVYTVLVSCNTMYFWIFLDASIYAQIGHCTSIKGSYHWWGKSLHPFRW